MASVTSIQDRVQETIGRMGYPDLKARLDTDGLLHIDGDPDRVKQAADELVSGGGAIVKYENGNDLKDEDYWGWGFAIVELPA